MSFTKCFEPAKAWQLPAKLSQQYTDDAIILLHASDEHRVACVLCRAHEIRTGYREKVKREIVEVPSHDVAGLKIAFTNASSG